MEGIGWARINQDTVCWSSVFVISETHDSLDPRAEEKPRLKKPFPKTSWLMKERSPRFATASFNSETMALSIPDCNAETAAASAFPSENARLTAVALLQSLIIPPLLTQRLHQGNETIVENQRDLGEMNFNVEKAKVIYNNTGWKATTNYSKLIQLCNEQTKQLQIVPLLFSQNLTVQAHRTHVGNWTRAAVCVWHLMPFAPHDEPTLAASYFHSCHTKHGGSLLKPRADPTNENNVTDESCMSFLASSP